ncbi:GNAT family N-acetyltransferase [Mesorhizobium neociceri]|uniref:GNAT family N-acetyltransferase n=1 Tax=Mesorhizobium neociceri TaxID=1307853 RepID=A0A838BAT9_9HYPH|nr:GNAT family N-acetyltransferase [Mesorhizobium neociceri]MBA1143197.1 GNAT family N-acetyltransferase [Mesorhizobium neociceri]
MGVIIRAAESSDLDAVVSIEATAFKTDWLGRAKLDRYIADGKVIVVVFNEDVAGFCVIRFRPGKPTVHLATIAVSETARAKGFGTRLLAAAEHEAARRGYRLLQMEVRADNLRALQFYWKAGFRRAGERPGYYSDGATAIRLRKRIAGIDFGATGRLLERAVFTLWALPRRQA